MNSFHLTTGFPAQPGASSSYYSLDLFIMAGMSRVLTAQVDTSEGKVISLSEYSYSGEPGPEGFYNALDAFLSEDALFIKPYRSETIAIEYPVSTYVPASLFDEKRLPLYLLKAFTLPSRPVYRNDEVNLTDIRNIYCLPEELTLILNSRLPKAKLRHFSTPLLSGLALLTKKSYSNEVAYCQVRKDLLDLVIFRSGKLIFSNTFPFNNKEEFIYYILFVNDQLGLEPGNLETVLLGETGKDSDLAAIAREYLGRITFINEPPEGLHSAVSGQPRWHRYFNLLSLRLCV